MSHFLAYTSWLLQGFCRFPIVLARSRVWPKQHRDCVCAPMTLRIHSSLLPQRCRYAELVDPHLDSG